MICLEFPWPPASLSPNANHGHWSQRAKARKPAREEAYWRAIQHRENLPEGEVMVRMTFYPPNRRRFDLDGLLGRCKPMLDGIADALEVDDYRFAFTLRRADPSPQYAKGAVTLEIGD